jgi:hypothetical protein
MKKAIIFIFIVYSTCLSAQNWSIINTSDKFNYRLDGENIFSATVWADSTFMNGNDTDYFMNRIVCDSCITMVGGPMQCNSCYGYKNAPQFLQKRIHFDGTIYHLTDTGNLIIQPFADLNDSWIFDSVSSVTATVINLSTSSVFQTIDSVKTILLSSGDSIILSKNYGILLFPDFNLPNKYYRLIGIEGRNLGEKVPRFADFFNFDIGDRFEYHYNGALGGGCNYWSIQQYTINSKTISGDTISYDVSGVFEEMQFDAHHMGFCSSSYGFGHFTNTIQYIDSADHFTNKYNMQPFNLAYRLMDSKPCGENDTAYDGVRMGDDGNNNIYKSFGFTGSSLPFAEFYSGINRNSDTLFYNEFGTDTYSAYYRVGLGMTEFTRSGCFEGGDYGGLTAYTKSGITFGVFSDSTAILLNTFNPKINSTKIYPVPADNKLFIQRFYRGDCRIQLINNMGVIIKEINLVASEDEISVEELIDGIYFIKIISESGTETQRIVILH